MIKFDIELKKSHIRGKERPRTNFLTKTTYQPFNAFESELRSVFSNTGIEPIKENVAVTINLERCGKSDIDNIAKAVLDALQGNKKQKGVIENDRQVKRLIITASEELLKEIHINIKGEKKNAKG